MTTSRQVFAAFWALLLTCSFSTSILAQKNKPIDLDSVSPNRLTALMGLQVTSGLDVGGIAWTLTAEKPLSHYKYVGVQLNFYLEAISQTDYTFFNTVTTYDRLSGKSFEACLFYKTFLSGKYTGRKGGLYYAPELRLGQMRYQYNLIEPFTFDGKTNISKNFMTSLGFRLGLQKEIDNMLIDICMAAGIRQLRKPVDSTNNRIRLEWNNYISPLCSMGMRF